VRITRLTLKDFRRYRDLEVQLAPGITVVRGPNEAGKTTLQRALELVLTRKCTGTGVDLDALRPWDADPDARPVVGLAFTDEDLDGSHVGSVEKAFRGPKGTVRFELDGEVVTDPALADQALAEVTGIPTEAFFRSTASVRHHEVADLDRDEANLRDRLQASISGADRGTSRAKKQLDRALRDLRTRGEKNPGRLKVAEESVARGAAAVEAGEAAIAQLEQDRDLLSSARERRAEAEGSLAERRSMLEKARQAERLTSEREAAQQRYERYRQAVTVDEELSALADSHPSTSPLPVLRSGVERLRDLDARGRELRAALAGEVEVQFDVPPEPTWRPLSRVALLLVAVALILGVGGFALDELAGLAISGITFVAAIIAGAAAVILAAVGLWLRRRDRLARQLRDVEIDRRLRGRSQIEAELHQVDQDTETQLGLLGVEDLAAAQDLLAREEKHVARIDTLNAQLEGLVGKEPSETLPRLRDAAALEAEQKASALDALGPIAKEPRARERLEVEVRDQETALERARDDEAGARARVEANTVDAEQVAVQAEQLAAWREQLAALQRRERVYAATLDALERAEQATMRTATRYLEKRMVTDLGRVTDGRYRRVRVDDASLDIAVFAPERSDWVPVSQLSQGTIDLVFLAARLGLVRLVTGDRRPPLVFDDPFVTLDDERAARALDVLRDLAGDFQVIYLTASERYDRAADLVVQLPGPTAVDTGAEAAETDETLPIDSGPPAGEPAATASGGAD
jgi:DNA repair exonuclease SbcCD ATPase subunit